MLYCIHEGYALVNIINEGMWMDAFLSNIHMFFYSLWNQIMAVVLSANFVDILDIALISYIIYKGTQMIRETRAQQLFKGIVLLFFMYLVAGWFGMATIKWLMDKVFAYAIIAVAIIFQPELRRALERMGRSNIFGRGANDDGDGIFKVIDAVCKSVSDMQDKKVGALLVFERKTPLGEIADTGTVLDADVSESLVSSVFFPNSPLHDGGMIIRGSRIYAAGCIFPLTVGSIGQDMGTRHRAAIGISENSDCIAIVVSEETGTISIAENGELTRDYNGLALRQKLNELLATKENTETKGGIVAKIKNIGGGNSDGKK